MKIKKSRCIKIIEEVRKTVNNFEIYALKAGVNRKRIGEI